MKATDPPLPDDIVRATLKLAVSVMGAFIATEAGLRVPAYEPEPLPAQLLN